MQADAIGSGGRVREEKKKGERQVEIRHCVTAERSAGEEGVRYHLVY